MTFMYFTGMVVGAVGMFFYSRLEDKRKYLEGYKAGMTKRLLQQRDQKSY